MCKYCDVKESTGAGGKAFLWGIGIDCEYEGDFHIVQSKDEKTFHLEYEDDESDNVSDPIKFCPLCGRELI